MVDIQTESAVGGYVQGLAENGCLGALQAFGWEGLDVPFDGMWLALRTRSVTSGCVLGTFEIDCDLIAAQTYGTLVAILDLEVHLPNLRAMYIRELLARTLISSPNPYFL